MSVDKPSEIVNPESSAGEGKQEKSVRVSALFTGPLPHPSVLKAYDNVLPGLAERIVVLAEGEADHRRNMNLKAMANERIGTFSGLAVAVSFAGVAAYALKCGHPTAASILGTGTLGSIIGAFVYGSRGKSPDGK